MAGCFEALTRLFVRRGPLGIVDEPLAIRTDAVDTQRLTAELQGATQLAEHTQVLDEDQIQEVHRAHSEKIAQLEARVSASLHAAMQRTVRIKELEELVCQGQEREERLKHLEFKMEEATREAEERAERVRELETALTDKGENPADIASAAFLEDALRLAEQILSSDEERVLDKGSLDRLRGAVQQLRLQRPSVTAPVADLVGHLVQGLRWPKSMRQRMSAAEQNMREGRSLHEHSKAELENMQHQRDRESSARLAAEAQSDSLKEQLLVAERKAVEVVGRLNELKCEASVEGIRMLKDQRDIDIRKLEQAEARAHELRERLQIVEKQCTEGLPQQESMFEAELQNETQHQHEADRQSRLVTDAQVEDLRQGLAAAERALDQASYKQQLSEKEHATELSTWRIRYEAAEQYMQRMQEEAQHLESKLEHAERSGSCASSRELELLRARVAEADAKLQGSQARTRELEQLVAAADASTRTALERQEAELRSGHQQQLATLNAQQAKCVSKPNVFERLSKPSCRTVEGTLSPRGSFCKGASQKQMQSDLDKRKTPFEKEANDVRRSLGAANKERANMQWKCQVEEQKAIRAEDKARELTQRLADKQIVLKELEVQKAAQRFQELTQGVAATNLRVVDKPNTTKDVVVTLPPPTRPVRATLTTVPSRSFTNASAETKHQGWLWKNQGA